MSSIFDVPVQLMLVLSLAAATAEIESNGSRRVAATGNVTIAVVGSGPRLQGPFRFSSHIWLRALKATPSEKGLGALSDRIFRTSSGRLYVPAAAERRQILDARFNGAIAGRVARSFAEHNAQFLRPAIGRKVNAGDLYIAHLLGPERAAKLIKLASERPNADAVEYAPDIARVLSAAAYGRRAPRRLGDLYARLTRPLRDYERRLGRVGVARAHTDSRLFFASLKPTLAENDHAGSNAKKQAARALKTDVRRVLSTPPPQ